MKINNVTTAFDAISKLQPEPAPATAAAVGRKEQPVGDQVKLSANAQLAQAAMGAVGQAADIRYDKVERAKALLASGELGSNPFRLADAIVARVMENE
jgi:flagellar biosynthesis anti-sigma factor FlgM